MEPSLAATPEWNTLWTWEEDTGKQTDEYAGDILISIVREVISYSDRLILVSASCQTEAQSYSHLLMENHHLHIVVVLEEGQQENVVLLPV